MANPKSWKNNEMHPVGTTVQTMKGSGTGEVLAHYKGYLLEVRMHRTGRIGFYLPFELRKISEAD